MRSFAAAPEGLRRGRAGALVDYLTHLADLGNTGFAFDLGELPTGFAAEPGFGLGPSRAGMRCDATAKKRMRLV